jgi:HPt (histidine-containing phosphotransfer) domain-containing protein
LSSQARSGMKHINLTFLKTNVSDNRQFIHELLVIFQKSLEDDLNALNKAIHIQDHDAIKRGAHKVKSGFRSLGMDDLASKLFELELMGFNADDMAKIRQVHQSIMGVMAEVKEEVAKAIEDHS